MSEASKVRLGILLALASSGASLGLGAASCGNVSVPSGASGTTSGTSATAAGTGGASSTTATGTGGASVTGTGGTSVTGTGGASVTTGAGGAPICPTGVPDKQCFTLEQLAFMLDHPPMGGSPPPPPPPGPPDPTDGGTDGGDGGTVLTDCVEASLVLDGCCNPASAGPSKENDLCCYWFCPGPCCGRALMVEGRARVSPVAARRDWTGARLDAPEALDPATRAALGEAWLTDAQMEHASIASFARFTLELLALGAPADLVEGAQRAALDEVAHARACFALASRYLGKEMGPGSLDVGGCAPRMSLVEAAAAAVAEGCIGESIAAVVAREQLAGARDAGVREALERIARDEEEHAALAFRFVRWAAAAGGESVRAAVRAAFAQGVAQARMMGIPGMVGEVNEALFAAHGRLGPGAMKRAVGMALEEVVMPCAEAALG
ncbi:MAG: ferritin-like domain-containing protein [Byssovorax sp.]